MSVRKKLDKIVKMIEGFRIPRNWKGELLTKSRGIKAISCLDVCEYQCIQRLRGIAPIFVQDKFEVGRICHKARERLTFSKRKYGDKISENKISQLVFSVLSNIEGEEENKIEAFELLRKEWRYELRLVKELGMDHVFPIVLEKPVKIGIFNGRVDGILKLKSGLCVPIEYKTERLALYEKQTRLQLIFYMLAIYKTFHVLPPYGVIQFTQECEREIVPLNSSSLKEFEKFWKKFENFVYGEKEEITSCGKCIYCVEKSLRMKRLRSSLG